MARFCGRTLPPGLKRQMVTTIRGIERGMGNGDSFCAHGFRPARRRKKKQFPTRIRHSGNRKTSTSRLFVAKLILGVCGRKYNSEKKKIHRKNVVKLFFHRNKLPSYCTDDFHTDIHVCACMMQEVFTVAYFVSDVIAIYCIL